MKTKLSSALTIALVVGWVGPAAAATTRPAEFAREFIRDLAEVQQLRDLSVAATRTGDNQFVGCVRDLTRMQLELRSQADAMRGMTLSGQLASVPQQIAAFYDQKIELYGRVVAGCSAFIAGPRQGVDYGKIAAEAPALTAQLDYADKSLFQATPLIAAALIDQKPDKQGHLSHLNITREERAALLKDISDGFRTHLNDKEPNYTVGSALLLRDFLQGDHKSSDEPW